MKGHFDLYKRDLLGKLNSGVDFSPKGSIDLPVVELVNFLNTLPGFVTTSSCSGRLSVYLNEHHTKGIRWIFVKHRTVQVNEVIKAITDVEDTSSDLVIVKCEAFILHVACRDIESARSLFQLAMSCGFRESGISIGQKHIIVAVRSTAFNLELPIARGNKLLVSTEYMNLIVDEANTRLRNNFSRTDRFFLELKKMYQFPSLSVTKTLSREESRVARWGHTSVTFPVDSSSSVPEKVVFGGYGSESSFVKNGTGEKCIRGLANVITHRVLKSNKKSPRVTHASAVVASEEIVNHCMHAASVHMTLRLNDTVVEVVVLSGGRTSPQAPLPCIQSITLASDLTKSLRYIEEGDTIPSPRWGHTLSVISEDSCLLYGGRNDGQLCSDTAYLVTFTLTTSDEVKCRWVKLDLSMLSEKLSFADPLEGSEVSAVAVPAPRCFHAAAPINDVYVEYGQNRCYVLVHGGLLSLKDPITSGEVFMINPWTQKIQVVSNTAPDKGHKSACEGTVDPIEILETADAKANIRKSGLGINIVKRFAHTLSKIGGKSLLLVGGVSSDLTGEEQSNTENQTVCIDLCMDGSGKYCVQYRKVPLFDRINDGSDEKGVVPALPCQECRNHHTVSYQPQTRRLLIEGGGLHGLAFGPHLCCSLDTTVSLGVELLPKKADNNDKPHKSRGPRTKDVAVKDKKAANKEKHHTPSSAKVPVKSEEKPIKAVKEDNSKDSLVVLCPASKVKTLKVYLESLQMLNKSFSISKVTPDALDKVKRIQCAEVVTVGDASSADVLEYSASVAQDIMALSVFPALVDLLQQQDPSREVLVKILEITQHPSVYTAMLPHSRASKRSLANTFQAASDYLTEIAHCHHLPLDLLPAKYEVVGHFLMIPENALCGEKWSEWLAADAERSENLWKHLSGIFGLSKVARKAVIDSGLLRESRVQLLLPAVGTPSETGPGSVGWNTVVENRISYSFDITRVMFCSGNITEKLRMANVKGAAGQTVVDFYCGIGYYTIPLLVHAKVAFVHACEWNPNSVQALRENMKANKVDPSRFNILQGDNRETSKGLVDVADRILLGLLPSSTAGWPLAVRALKPTGGIIHVHENVVDSELAAWVEATVIEFERQLRESGKPLQVEKVHLEKVKSYAPHIYHVVLDLKCF